MVKVKRNEWLKSKAIRGKYILHKKIRTVLITSLGFLIFQTGISQNPDETTLYGETKVHNLKYLRSLSAIEKSDEGENARFISKFSVDLTSGFEVKVVADTWIKSEPTFRAHNSHTVIPEGTRVRAFQTSDCEDFLAVKYRNKWGFIHENSVTKTEE